MSRATAIGFGAAAVLASAGATVLLGTVIGEYHARLEAARRGSAPVYVAVAARDLYPGLPIGEDDLYAVQMPPAYVPEGAFLDPEFVIGRIARERVLANEVVRGERLADATSHQGLNVMVPRGLRAMSVPIRDGQALAGFLNPGNLVDVLVTVPAPDTGREETTTLLQAVYVLGVDSRLAGETADEARARRGAHDPTVTLLVDPADAERVAHADFLGDLRLTMRTGTDATVIARAPAPRAKATGARPTPAAAPPLPACREVWIWHGNARTVLVVDDHGKPAEPGSCAPAP